MIWFKLWLFAVRQGVWKDPALCAVAFLQTCYIVLVLFVTDGEAWNSGK